MSDTIYDYAVKVDEFKELKELLALNEHKKSVKTKALQGVFNNSPAKSNESYKIQYATLSLCERLINLAKLVNSEQEEHWCQTLSDLSDQLTNYETLFE